MGGSRVLLKDKNLGIKEEISESPDILDGLGERIQRRDAAEPTCDVVVAEP